MLNLQINLPSNKPFTAVPGRAAGRGAGAGWWCVAVLHTTNLIEKAEKAVFYVIAFYYFLYNLLFYDISKAVFFFFFKAVFFFFFKGSLV
jgi:hypothetical protein